jgi:SAM-dependent methyltransferase
VESLEQLSRAGGAPARCRLCGATLTTSVVDLGATPLANQFVTPEQAAAGVDACFPLHVWVCDACLLVQVDTVVPPAAIFSDYPYLSSVSSSWVAHARGYADAMIVRFGLGPGSLVVEIASNDGYLLRHFAARGVPVLGIEPAANVAAIARAGGVPTRVAFFGRATALALAGEGLRADLMAANNVLAHVPDIRGFVAGFASVLAPEGVATFEFPHLLRLLAGVQFDTIYHEHYSYLSLLVVERLLAMAGLRAFDVAELPTHGGSLRVYACHASASHEEQASVPLLRGQELQAGLGHAEGYAAFSGQVSALQRGFRAFLAAAQSSGRRVAAYGAAAKGCTLLNTCGVDRSQISHVADRNPAKQGRLLPGCHIPVVPPEALLRERPDDIVILPWNIAEEVAAELAPLRRAGTRLWVAVPEMAEV